MCGIWAYLLHNQVVFDHNNNLNDCMSIQGRGPDDFHVSYYKDKYAIGFHRLSIMDPSFNGSQPFIYTKNNVKCPLNKTYLMNSLNKYFANNPNIKTDEIGKFIMENRETKTKESIRHKLQKNT